jgi:diketogulonate reductase-like aldo/keto reductase
LMKTNLLQDEVVLKIAAAHAKTAAQVLIRWSVQSNVITIPKSVTDNRIRENFQVFDFALSEEEMVQLNALDRNQRFFEQNFHGVPTFS